MLHLPKHSAQWSYQNLDPISNFDMIIIDWTLESTQGNSVKAWIMVDECSAIRKAHHEHFCIGQLKTCGCLTKFSTVKSL